METVKQHRHCRECGEVLEHLANFLNEYDASASVWKCDRHLVVEYPDGSKHYTDVVAKAESKL